MRHQENSCNIKDKICSKMEKIGRKMFLFRQRRKNQKLAEQQAVLEDIEDMDASVNAVKSVIEGIAAAFESQ